MIEERKEVKDIRLDFIKFAKKHKLTDYAVCGTKPDGIFVGFYGNEQKTFTQAFSCVVNIARLWQFARESVREMMLKLDKLGG